MSERKLIIEVGINDDAVNSIEDLEREILAQGNSQIIIYHPPVAHTGLLIDNS